MDDRLFCPSLSPRVCSNSCPRNCWCHPTISSSVASFFSCPQSFPASGSFPMSRLFISGGQSIGASASASVFPMNIQSWFLLGLIGLISLLSKGFSRVFSSTTIEKHQFFGTQPSLWSNFHIRTWLLEKLCVCVCVCLFAQLCPTLCDPLDYTVHGILQARIQEWKKRNILFLLQGIFPTQGLSPGLLHCRWILYQLSHKGNSSFEPLLAK